MEACRLGRLNRGIFCRCLRQIRPDVSRCRRSSGRFESLRHTAASRYHCSMYLARHSSSYWGHLQPTKTPKRANSRQETHQHTSTYAIGVLQYSAASCRGVLPLASLISTSHWNGSDIIKSAKATASEFAVLCKSFLYSSSGDSQKHWQISLLLFSIALRITDSSFFSAASHHLDVHLDAPGWASDSKLVNVSKETKSKYERDI